MMIIELPTSLKHRATGKIALNKRNFFANGEQRCLFSDHFRNQFILFLDIIQLMWVKKPERIIIESLAPCSY